MTIIHEIKNVDSKKFYQSGEQESLDFSDEDLKGIDELWYYYFCGCYEGSGVALLRIGDLYSNANLGHCSCNSPQDGINDCKPDSYITLEKLKEVMTKELNNEMEPIFNFMENKNVN